MTVALLTDSDIFPFDAEDRATLADAGVELRELAGHAPFSVPSPRPVCPSSVWTRVTSQFFQPALTVIVSIRAIFIERSPAGREPSPRRR